MVQNFHQKPSLLGFYGYHSFQNSSIQTIITVYIHEKRIIMVIIIIFSQKKKKDLSPILGNYKKIKKLMNPYILFLIVSFLLGVRCDQS